ncbi:MAG: DAK2 domain-containing protein [Clostridia bacterium]|nr:DAK2 domain-containing protein [Clostridia bacterium]
MQKNINGVTFRKMILASASILEENKEYVNSLNVFPVPDGDTGTNMSLTLKSACTEVSTCPNNELDCLANAFSKGALKGARGNSGVILSQIIKGFCSVLNSTSEIDTKIMAKAFDKGAEVAYSAVTKPKEGTILTVIRVMAEQALKLSKKITDMDEFFSKVLQEGELILQQTPEMLPVLKKAGVVDAGGRGLLIIFTGFYRVISDDETLEIAFEKDLINAENFEQFHINLNNLEDIEFAYCTEYMVIQMKKKTTEADIDKMREKLMQIGDSVICIGDLSLVKVHVHTNEPNLALGYALELGEINNLKIDNMVEQNRQLKSQQNSQVELKEYGMVSVAAGSGLNAIMKDLGIDEVIQGGQTMNPSVDDIARAVNKVNAKNIFVFPNNKNIILAAEQAKNLTTKAITVIPTKSIPEGISAALNFNEDCSLEDNIVTMLKSLETVFTGSITYAVRNTNIDGFDLKEGDIIGLNSKAILSKGDKVSEVAQNLIEKMMTDEFVNITLFYGQDVKEEDALSLGEKLEKIYPNHEVTVLQGNQPVYYYIISLE